MKTEFMSKSNGAGKAVVLITAIVCVVLIGKTSFGFSGTSSDIFAKMEEAFQRGELDSYQRVFYKAAAVRAPWLLPLEWRQKAALDEPGLKCATPVMLDAFLNLENLRGARREELRDLLSPRRGDYAYSIQVAEPYALRVWYDSDIYEDLAQTILDAAITSYERLVADWGFFKPPIESGSDYYEFYIDETEAGVAGYTASYESNPDTAFNDAFSYIVIGSSNSVLHVPSVVAHEFCHACQAATDIREPIALWENTSTYIQSQVFLLSFEDTASFFRYFQSEPQLPLEYGVQSGAFPLYMYGGSLWIYAMEYLYGDSDPAWIADIWSGCIQESGLNEPDYFDVLSDRLEGEGGFREMVPKFAQYRYFVGADGDGLHLPGADDWLGSEVKKERTWTDWDLPLAEQSPSASNLPQPNGCNYVVLETHEERGVEFFFSGDPDTEWNVDVMRVKQGEETVWTRMEIDDEGRGSADAQGGPDVELVMAVCHLAKDNYDPDPHSWAAAEYTYSIEKEYVEPQIQLLVPNALYRGDQNVLVSIIGKDFVDHEALTFRVLGEGVQITDPSFEASTTITGRASVDPDAALGLRDVAVLLPDGSELVGQGMISIESRTPVPDAGQGAESGSGGCDCASLGMKTGPLLLSLLFL